MARIKSSAAVVLLREAPGSNAAYEVFLVRRDERLRFMGGFHAFPGGTTDASDDEVAVAAPPVEPAFCSTAIRELFEETGVLLSRGAENLPSERLDALRGALLDEPDAWPALLAANGLGLDGTMLEPFGVWVTPPYTPVRFYAHYLAAWLPRGQQPSIWPGELTEGTWLAPADAIALHERGRMFISYPVLETLRIMRTHGADVEAAAAELVARGDDAYPHAGGEMVTGVHISPLKTFTLPPATHTNAYVVGGRELVVIDPASPIEEEQERLATYLDLLVERGGTLKEIWLTHHHKDHVGAVDFVRNRYDLPVAAHRRTAELGGIQADRFIEDGEVSVLDTGLDWSMVWEALHTPGHAPGHLCFFERTNRSLITGDNVLGLGTVMISPPEGNMQQYIDSLVRLRDLDAGFLFPAHGPPVAGARNKIQEYIDHRTAREEAIVAALDEKRTPSEIVPIVYTDVAPAVYPLAEVNVRAHLEKLLGEGRVIERDGTFARAV